MVWAHEYWARLQHAMMMLRDVDAVKLGAYARELTVHPVGSGGRGTMIRKLLRLETLRSWSLYTC